MTATLKNKNYKRSQTGRSMVEMLGVLAIVGVLSVGGVYGYGVAMKKHKANELLHQASILATTISAQIQSKGELPTTIEDFGNGKYGTFGTPEKVNDEQFTMQITGMDPAVCEQMEKMAGGMVRKAECNGTTLTLTYNNNLSSEKVAADYNGKQDECEDSGRKYCSGSSSCVALDKECGCSGTNNGCQKCDTETGSFITDDEKEGANCTTADGKKGTCSSGVCEETRVPVKKIIDMNKSECDEGDYYWCEMIDGCVQSSGYCPDTFNPPEDITQEDCEENGWNWDGNNCWPCVAWYSQSASSQSELYQNMLVTGACATGSNCLKTGKYIQLPEGASWDSYFNNACLPITFGDSGVVDVICEMAGDGSPAFTESICEQCNKGFVWDENLFKEGNYPYGRPACYFPEYIFDWVCEDALASLTESGCDFCENATWNSANNLCEATE